MNPRRSEPPAEEAEQAQKAAAERGGQSLEAALQGIALLPDVLKANYINKIQSDSR